MSHGVSARLRALSAQLPVAIGDGAPGCGIKKSGGDVWCAVVDGGNGPVTAIQISDDEL